MASATNLIGCPPAQVLNPIINAYQGKDPDRSSKHFAQKILTFFRNPLSMFGQVTTLMQVPACRGDAVNIVHQQYAAASMFTIQGGPPANAGQGGTQGGPPTDIQNETPADATTEAVTEAVTETSVTESETEVQATSEAAPAETATTTITD